MSYHEYLVGGRPQAEDVPFYALIQAAMRRADTDNLIKLRRCWPEVWAELQTRYHAPDGTLPGEVAVDRA